MRTRRNAAEAETTGQVRGTGLPSLDATAHLTGLVGSLIILGVRKRVAFSEGDCFGNSCHRPPAPVTGRHASAPCCFLGNELC